jgi:hypothetical protein
MKFTIVVLASAVLANAVPTRRSAAITDTDILQVYYTFVIIVRSRVSH